jgi:hypothetical protein
MLENLSGVQAEWLILGDAAQVVGNKLYLLGGGWDVLTVNSGFPVEHTCAVAASFSIPWSDTNQRHEIALEVQDADAGTLMCIAGQVEIGRPPGIPHGTVQRAQIVADMRLEFTHPGTYVLIARVGDQESKRITFNVVAGSRSSRQAEGANR